MGDIFTLLPAARNVRLVTGMPPHRALVPAIIFIVETVENPVTVAPVVGFTTCVVLMVNGPGVKKTPDAGDHEPGLQLQVTP